MKNWIIRIFIVIPIVILLTVGFIFQPIRIETSEPYTYTTYQTTREQWDSQIIGFADYNGTLETFDNNDFSILGPGQYNLTLPTWPANNIILLNESVSSVSFEWIYYHSFSGNNPPRWSDLDLQQDLRYFLFIGNASIEDRYNPLPHTYGPLTDSTKQVTYEVQIEFNFTDNFPSEINQIEFESSFFVNATCASDYFIQYSAEWRVDIEYSRPQNHTIDVPIVRNIVPTANLRIIGISLSIVIALWVLFELLSWSNRPTTKLRKEHTE